jgi:glycosidase
MKLYQSIFLTVFLAFSHTITSQVVTTSPILPTVNNQVVITLNTTGTALQGYAGDVYAHTGVIVEGSTAWQYVKGTWGANTSQPKLTKVSSNTYTLTISPNIREYYAVPSDKVIEKMAFVFRSQSSPYLQTSPDIFINVYAEGLTVNISSPEQDKPFYSYGANINISVQANNSETIKLYINNQEVSSSSSAALDFSHQINAYGKQWIKAIAQLQTDKVADSVYFYVIGNIPQVALPSGVIPGINYTGSNEVTLVLQDPPAKKEFVFAIGDFSDWDIDENFLMNRTPDGTHYWKTISGLDPQREYLFQYWVDGKLKIADPYSEKISDPWNDKWISSTTFPNLVAYPEGKTTGVVSVLQVEQNNFYWESNGYTPPAKEKLVIYELHIRDFVSDDYIVSVMDKLDYLEKLGVNAIELMPINEFEGNDSWGYNPSFHFATDKAYGTKNNYKKFIDECHKRGMAVIIDMVLNHSFGLSPLVQMYFNPSAGQYGQPTADNPWFNETCPHPPYCWGYDFDHTNQHTKDYIDRVAKFWLTEFKVDGFRFDFTKGFTNILTSGEGSAYNSQRIGILKRYADFIWSVNPSAYVILEHFADNTEEKELAEYKKDEGKGMLIWGNTNYNYNEASMGWLTNSNFGGVSYKQRGWSAPHLVGYMESHDEERLMFKNITYGNSSNPEHNVKNISIGLKRQKLVGTFFFTIPGPKMIWQFGELGYDFSIDYNDRVGRKPVRWDYYDNTERRSVYNSWAEVIALRNSLPVFSSNDYSVSLSGAGKRVTLMHNDMNVVIVGNFDVTQKDIAYTFPNTGKWYEYYSQTEINIASTTQTLSMQPGEYRIYSTSFINRNDYIVSTPTIEFKTPPLQVDIWPNPLNSLLNIEIQSDKKEQVDISLFDVNGRFLSTILNGSTNPGFNHFEWQKPTFFEPGLYFIVFKSPSYRIARKLVMN